MNRRELIGLVSGGVAAAAFSRTSASSARSGVRPAIKAIAFDAFPILDPQPVFRLAAELFPDRGAEFSSIWRTRQFEYQWLRALSGRYADFWETTEDALVFAARTLELDLTSRRRFELMNAFLNLRAWPDVRAVLTSLRAAGLRLAFLSNATPQILQAGIRSSGLEDVFEHVLSTDGVKTFKPDPRAYRMGREAFGLATDEILFVAFAGWDAAGAKWFGYPTFWMNRTGQSTEQLGVTADGIGESMSDLLRFLDLAPTRSPVD